jgi:hypothetical protein
MNVTRSVRRASGFVLVGDSETIIRWHLDEQWVGVDVAFMGNLGRASRIRTGRFQISQLACGD